MDEPSEGLAPLIVAEVGRTIARLGRVAFAGGVGEVRDNESLITQHLGVF